jgi:ribose transport system ATP-binding protein
VSHQHSLTGAESAELQVEPALVCANISKTYASNRAADDVTFEVQQGSIHGLLGGNGSGKSTVIKILAGVVEADAGRIRVGGDWHELASHSPQQAAELGLKFVHQQNSTFSELTVAENLAIARGFRTGVAGRIRWSEQRRWTKSVLDRFEIPATPDTPVATLGAAMQMMVAIARALQDTDGKDGGVLVLDEPTQGVDVGAREEIHKLIRAAAKQGAAVLVASSEFEELVALCDRALVVHSGQVVDEVTAEELTEDVLNERVYAKEVLL